MPLLRWTSLQQALSQGRLGGVFFLFGSAPFLCEEAAAAIVAAHVDPATRDFNLDQLRGGEVKAETLGSVLETPPLMAQWRVVVVREAQALATSPHLKESVEALVRGPPPGLALILIAQIPERSKAQFYERLKRGARAVELNAPDESDLPAWLIERAEAAGLELELEAARALAAAVGVQPGTLARELEKLAEVAGDASRITADHVAAAVRGVPRENRWNWFDRVGNAQFADARVNLPILLDAGETGVGLVIGLGTHLLRLAIVATGGKRALEKELRPQQRWLARRFAAQARHWTEPRLTAALDDLLRADRLLKSASLSDLQVMDELLLRLHAAATPELAPV